MNLEKIKILSTKFKNKFKKAENPKIIFYDLRENIFKYNTHLKFSETELVGLSFMIFLLNQGWHENKIVNQISNFMYIFEISEILNIAMDTCDRCDGGGEITCHECVGYGWVECGECRGEKEIECDECDGSGEIEDENCYNCGGDGFENCPTCMGQGEIKCDTCHGTQFTECDKCDGTGEIELLGYFEVQEFIFFSLNPKIKEKLDYLDLNSIIDDEFFDVIENDKYTILTNQINIKTSEFTKLADIGDFVFSDINENIF